MIPDITDIVWQYTKLLTKITQGEVDNVELWEVWQENALLFPRFHDVNEEIRKHRHRLDNAIRLSKDNCL
jgi:hypothetical protein